MNLAEFWPQCLRLLRTELNEQQFNMIIAPLTVGEEDGAWVIYAKNQFSLNLLRSQYGSKLETAREILVPEGPVLLLKIGNGKVYQISEELVSTDLTEAANGVKTPHETGETLVPGQADSAPSTFNPKRIAMMATILSALLFGLYYANYVYGWVGVESLDLTRWMHR